VWMAFESIIPVWGAGVALLFLRLVLGQIFLVHGWKKVKKKEAGGSSKYIFLGVLEVIFGLMMIVGLLVEFAALFYIVIMLGALYMKLFVWPDQKYVGNMEYDVLIMLAALVIFVLGPGVLAVF
jgi:uncharacterized membrane protein YphA (DoxX/SURF4 family)